ncbi:MAG: Lrp/AsnC family transcriptional regulator [Candidatus Bathyarchaeota archaeon]|nr:Lrp/AsnC family transcriptional regulator [Candidatus Bathyarchaeota archaeon]
MDLDEEIIKLLQADSRQSYRDIAKQLEISHVSVSSKVKTLEESGVIKGYTTIINPDKMNIYPLCLRISAGAGADLGKIGEKIAEYPEMNTVMRVSGDCELIVLAMCRSRESALKLLDEINTIKGIGKVESHIVLEAIKLAGVKVKS